MKFHSTVIFVKKIEQSKDFYTGYLDFSVEHDFGKNVILSNGLTIWDIQDNHIISKQLETRKESSRFELYFESEDIDTKCNLLEKAGVKFLHKIHEEPWGQRTFRFFDPDDHLIEVGEPLEVFVSNMSSRGMSVKQISEQSGIPIDTLITLIQK